MYGHRVAGTARPFRQVLAAVVAAVLSVSGLVAGQRAVALGPSAPSLDRAIAVFYRDTASFLVLKRLRGGGFDWSDDGCSVPPSLRVSVPALSYASRVFVDECRQHDFAYRNFGGRLHLDTSAARRRSVDSFFYAQLRRRCSRADMRGVLRRRVCLGYARAFYYAVRMFGRL